MAESKTESEEKESEEKDSEERSDDEDSGDEKDSVEELLLDFLMEVHSLEEQGSKQLEGAIDLTEGNDLEQLFKDHLEQTRDHEEQIRKRIEARETKPSAIKDLTMQAGAGVGLRYLDEEPADTPVKLAMHMFCLENLEVATYEILKRIAEAAGDDDTAQAAEKILGEEREMVDKLCDSFDTVVDLLGEYGGKDEDEDDDGKSDDEGDESKDDDED
jgi:ferritin-like metal-binding protein YciE